MELRELLDKTDKRKTKIELYKLYSINSMNDPAKILAVPLELNTGCDVFATSPTAALEYELRKSTHDLDGLAMALANDMAENLQDAFSGFMQAYDVLPDEEKKDAFKVTTREYPSGTSVETTTMSPIAPGAKDHCDRRNIVAIVKFTIPVSELEKYPAAYDENHDPIATESLDDNLVALTLQDRAFEMETKVYKLKTFCVKYTKPKKPGERDRVKVSEISLEEIEPNLISAE